MKLSEAISDLIGPSNLKRWQNHVTSELKSGSLSEKFSALLQNVELDPEEEQSPDAYALLLVIQDKLLACSRCRPSEFTGDEHCKMPLRPALGRDESPARKLKIYWTQCQVYREWAEDRKKAREVRDSMTKRKGGY